MSSKASLSEKRKEQQQQQQQKYSSKFLALAGLALFFLIAGLFLVNQMIFVSIPIVIFLALASFSEPQKRIPQVSITRVLEKVQFRVGETSAVKLVVKNVGSSEISLIRVRDLIPSYLDGEDTQSGFALSLKKGESKELFYEICGATFGAFRIGPVKISASDLLGLREFETVVNVYSSVLVLPENNERLSKFMIHPRKTKPWPGEIASRRTGFGMNYYSIRPMLSGELMKRVNWKASARTSDPNQLLVNEFMAELGAEALIIVDGREVSEIGARPDSTLSYSIKAAFSIADRLLRARNRVGLLTVSSNGTRIPAGQGRRQFNRISHILLDLLPGESANIEYVSSTFRSYYPNISQVILISPLVDDSSFRIAANIRRSGYDLIVVSPNPLDFDANSKKRSKTKDGEIAQRLAELERSSNISELRSANTLVIDWRKSTPLEEVIEANNLVWTRSFSRPGK